MGEYFHHNVADHQQGKKACPGGFIVAVVEVPPAGYRYEDKKSGNVENLNICQV